MSNRVRFGVSGVLQVFFSIVFIGSLVAAAFYGYRRPYICLPMFLSVGLIIICIGRGSIVAVVLAIIITPISFLFLGPGPSYQGPADLIRQDANNLRRMRMNIAFYKEDEFGTFPRRLSQLEAHYERIGQTNGVPDIFVCPRGAGKLDERYDGPLRKPHEPDPGPVLVITNWSQVDDGDYLYLQPPSNAEDTKPNTIILMTRPGLLYAGTVNIALLTGEVRTLKKEEWQRNSEVQLFLDMIRKSPGSPMKGSDQDKKAPP